MNRSFICRCCFRLYRLDCIDRFIVFSRKDCEDAEAGDVQLGDDGDNVIGSSPTVLDGKDGKSGRVGYQGLLKLTLLLRLLIC